MALEGKWEVFETPDEGASGAASGDASARRPEMTSSEDVVTSALPAPEVAFEVFAGRRFVRGAAAPPAALPAAAESPFERYNRLRAEVDALAKDLQLGEGDEVGRAHSEAYERLARGVGALSNQLDELRGDRQLQVVLASHVADQAAVVSAGRALVSAAASGSAAAASAAPAAGGVRYELFYSPGALHQADEQVLARVRRLEAVLGINERGAPPARSLVQTVAALEDKIALLDEGRVSLLAHRAKELAADVDELSRARADAKAAAVASGASLDDATDVLERLDKCSAVAVVVPALIERLRTVQEIHQHNAHVHSRLDALDRAQLELESANRLDRELLESLKQGLRDNVKTVEANLAKLAATAK
jgi:hypothetical protein